jgi:hypothetical protein
MRAVLVVLAGCGATAAPIANAPPPHHRATTVDEVLDGALVAVGGRARIARVVAIHTIGRVEVDGQVTRFETFSRRPDRAYTRFDTSMGTSFEVVRGDLGWKIATDGSAQLLAASERADFVHETAELYATDWRAAYAKAVLVGTETFAGEPAFRVALTDHRDRTKTHFFAVDTLRELGQETTRPDGRVVRDRLSDIRDLGGGVRYPFRSEREPPGHFVVQFELVELDRPIAPETFEPPDAVKRLL